MGIDSDPTIEDPRVQASRELEKAKEEQEIALKKSVPTDKLERDYKSMEVDGATITEQRPALERMKLDIQAGLQTVKDALGVSDFARASKEVERLKRQLKEMQD